MSPGFQGTEVTEVIQCSPVLVLGKDQVIWAKEVQVVSRFPCLAESVWHQSLVGFPPLLLLPS